jgi:hypothetical protein
LSLPTFSPKFSETKENMKNKLLALFRRKQPVYGWAIFEPRPWLSRKVDDAIWKRHFGLD